MFPPISVTDTKIIYGYNFAAPLTQKVFFSLVFFFYFFLVTFSGRTGKSFLVNIFIISYQESVWPRSDSLLGHTKTFFRKNCSWSCYSWRVWHMTRLKHGNQPPLDETHLVAARRLIHQEVSTKVRQRGELNWALQLKPSGQQISSTTMSRPESIVIKQD